MSMEWQPIETAQKDGTPVDLWVVSRLTYNHAGRRIINVKWDRVTDFMGCERMDWAHGHGEDVEPTHWMPTPEPPES